MTGLAGLFSLDGPVDAGVAASQVEAMGRAQAHRGGVGWRVASYPRFVHLVSSQDSPHGAEAPVDQRGAGAAPLVAFDGVITNRGTVRDQLRRAGADPGPGGDRELVRRAWQQWGAKCIDKLTGRFAFVVHDPVAGHCYLVRDQFGHKPFHYAIRGNRLYFASEIKTLLAVTSPAVLNERALLEWSLYGDVLPPRTLFRGIDTLAPGHLLQVGLDGGAQRSRSYYDPADVVDPARYAEYSARSIEESLAILESTADAAIAGHMDGREDVGVMLSGGVDSTVVAALAARHGEIRTYNFSVRGDHRLDESSMAEQVARKLGLPLEVIAIDGPMYRRELARTTNICEMPLWHMQEVPTQMLVSRARKDGIGLLLSGVSIGPLLGASTDRYHWILPSPLLGHLPPDVLRVASKAVYAASALPVASPFFTRTLGIALQLLDGGDRRRKVAHAEEVYGFLKDRSERKIHVMRMSDNAQFLPRFFYQGDRLCMSESIEYCDAAVDPDYMAMALNMPTGKIYRKRTFKWLLKELATRYVPREVAFQKKVSLDVPVGEYFAPLAKPSLFNGGFLESYLGLDWDAAKSLLAGASDAPDAPPFLFQLANIETWGRMFFMKQSVDDVASLLSDGPP